jgi:hypothetical protein
MLHAFENKRKRIRNTTGYDNGRERKRVEEMKVGCAVIPTDISGYY